MSLAIDCVKVGGVLLVDGWHEVAPGTFGCDAYEYLWSGMGATPYVEAEQQMHANGQYDYDPVLVHGGGQGGVCSTGFSFTTPDGEHLYGPLTAILAVKVRP